MRVMLSSNTTNITDNIQCTQYPGVPVIFDRTERCVLRQQTPCRLMKLYVPTNVGVHASLDDDN